MTNLPGWRDSIGLNLLLVERHLAGSATVVRAQFDGGARNRAGILGRDLAFVAHVARHFKHHLVAIHFAARKFDRAAASCVNRSAQIGTGLLESEGLRSTLTPGRRLAHPLPRDIGGS